jgi:hypothetical protein
MYIWALVVIIITGGYLFLRLYPPFGGHASLTNKRRSSNFVDNKFVNQISTPMNISLASLFFADSKATYSSSWKPPTTANYCQNI